MFVKQLLSKTVFFVEGWGGSPYLFSYTQKYFDSHKRCPRLLVIVAVYKCKEIMPHIRPGRS